MDDDRVHSTNGMDDRASPEAFLASGLHEWLSGGVASGERGWIPALGVVGALARWRSSSIVWIGRRAWPGVTCLTPESVLVDPPPRAHAWAVVEAMRSAGVDVVVADASGMDMGVSRRLQLASERGNVLGLLVRPASERRALSAAKGRWMVEPRVDDAPSFDVTLLRAKGASSLPTRYVAGRPSWTSAWEATDACPLRVAPDVERRSGASAKRIA